MKYICVMEFLVESAESGPEQNFNIRSVLEQVAPVLERLARRHGLKPITNSVRAHWARRHEIINMTPRKNHLVGEGFVAACGNYASKRYLHESLDGIEKNARCKLCSKGVK